MAAANSIEPLDDIVAVAAPAEDHDATALYGVPARYVEATSDGDLVIVTVDGGVASPRTIAVTSGWSLAVKVVTIKAATTADVLLGY